MNDEFFMPGRSHFENENGWSGSRGVLCYEVERPKEGQMRAVTWYGPFSRDYAVEDGESFFPVSEEGIAEMKQWLLAQAEEMNTHPKRTPQECQAHYDRLSGGGD